MAAWLRTAALLGGLLVAWVALLATAGAEAAGVAPAAWPASGGAAPRLGDGASALRGSGVGLPPPVPAAADLPVAYTITARLDAKKHRVGGTLELTWRNPSGAPAESLPFHLYLNAFAHQGTRFLDSAWRHGSRDVLRKGGWGDITVRDVRVDGEAAARVALEDDGTVLRVVPARPVGPRATARITLGFDATLPKLRARTGYAGDYHVVAQWFPKLGVRDPDGTWHCHPFHLTSEFYADFGAYDVTLEVPEGFEIAATGERRASERSAGGGRRFRYRAAPVHDFVWVAAPGLERRRGRLGSVALEVVHRGEPPAVVARHLRHVREALDRLQRWFAPYPYPVLTAVLVPPAAEAAGGMEYPTLFTSAADHPPLLERAGPLNTTVHELVHQYFYGLLASDELSEPWLDEGFTTYVTGLVMDDLYGRDRSAIEAGPLSLGYFPLVRIGYRELPGRDAPRRPAPDFASPGSYVTNVYGKTALALRTLEGRIGLGPMRALLADYVRQYRFRHPRGADFLRVLDAHVSDPSLRRFFREAVSTDGVLDYAVDRVQVRPLTALEGRFESAPARARQAARRAELDRGLRHLNRVLLVRKGELRIPVPVVLRFADGSRLARTWDGEARWHWLEIPHRHRLVSAEIDPARTLALERTLLDNGRQVAEDPRPARRLASRVLLGLQIALQAVGF